MRQLFAFKQKHVIRKNEFKKCVLSASNGIMVALIFLLSCHTLTGQPCIKFYKVNSEFDFNKLNGKCQFGKIDRGFGHHSKVQAAVSILESIEKDRCDFAVTFIEPKAAASISIFEKETSNFPLIKTNELSYPCNYFDTKFEAKTWYERTYYFREIKNGCEHIYYYYQVRIDFPEAFSKVLASEVHFNSGNQINEIDSLINYHINVRKAPCGFSNSHMIDWDKNEIVRTPKPFFSVNLDKEAFPKVNLLFGAQSAKVTGNETITMEKFPIEIYKIKSLRSLEFSEGKNLKILPEGISNLDSLKELYIGFQNLDSFQQDFGGMRNLESLTIRSGGLTKLPYSLVSLPKLKRLMLICKNLKELPSWIGKMQSLEELVIDFTSGIRTLPKEIGELKQLKILKISDRLVDVPIEINELSNLEILVLPYDRWEKLTLKLSNLKNLKRLVVPNKCNNIDEVLQAICNMPNLESLTINLDNASLIPNCISDLQNIRFISIDAGSICGLPKFSAIQNNIDSLFLYNVKSIRGIKQFPNIKVFEAEAIYASGTYYPLAGWEELTFLKQLKRFKIGGCLIDPFPEQILELDNLEELSFRNARVYELPFELNKLRRLKWIETPIGKNRPFLKIEQSLFPNLKIY